MFKCTPASYIKNICSSINATWWRDDGTSSLPPSPVRLSWQARNGAAAFEAAAGGALAARPPPSPSRHASIQHFTWVAYFYILIVRTANR